MKRVSWKGKNVLTSKRAAIIGPEYERLGSCTARRFLQEARNTDSPCHSLYPFDDLQGSAEKHWLHLVRTDLRNLIRVEEDLETQEVIEMPAAISFEPEMVEDWSPEPIGEEPESEPNDDKVYVRMPDILESERLCEQWAEQAYREFLQWRRRYGRVHHIIARRWPKLALCFEEEQEE